MADFKIFDIAASGMSASSLRLNLVASNLSNADSVSSSVGGTYRARQPVFAADLQNAIGQRRGAAGVRVLGVVESNAPPQMEYAPDHPMADADGYIFKTNVNMVEEMANMMSASRSYQNNVEVMDTAKQLILQTLRMGQ